MEDCHLELWEETISSRLFVVGLELFIKRELRELERVTVVRTDCMDSAVHLSTCELRN